MREIRFRGLSKNGWVFGLPFYSPGTGTWKIVRLNGWVPSYSNPDEGESNEFIDVDGTTISEFTGLKDHNGVQIFEGDILEYKNDLGKHILHKVFYTEGGLVINSHKSDLLKSDVLWYDACADMQTSQWIKQCLVTGNIHQNPELLK